MTTFRLSVTPHKIKTLLLSSNVEEQEIGLRNAIELSTEMDGIDYLTILDVISPILSLVSSRNEVIRMLACWAITNICKKNEIRSMITAEGIVDYFPDALNTSNPAVIDKVLASISTLIPSLSLDYLEKTFKLLLHMFDIHTDPKILKYYIHVIIEVLLNRNLHSIFLDSNCLSKCVSILSSDDYEAVKMCLALLFLLSTNSSLARFKVIDEGILKPLSSIISCCSDDDIVDLALQLLVNLSFNEGREKEFIESNLLIFLIDIMNFRNNDLKIKSAMILANLSLSPLIRDNIMLFGWDLCIGNLLKSCIVELQRQTLRFIINISSNDVCRKLLLDANILSIIKELYSNSTESIKEILEHARSNLEVPILNDLGEFLNQRLIEVEIDEDDFTNSNKKNSMNQKKLTILVNPKDSGLYLKRGIIVKEILSSEESYVHSLNMLMNHYYNPLMQMIENNDLVLTSEEMDSIFSVINVIHGIHNQFLPKLSSRLEKWVSGSCIGDLFVLLCKSLNVYKSFVNNYENSKSCYDNLIVKNKKFENFIKECESKVPEIQYLGLTYFLIQPIKRLEKYLLLLEQVLQYTPENHIDKEYLKSSILDLRDITSLFNGLSRTGDYNANSLKVLNKMFNSFTLNYKDKTYNLLDPERKFIKFGTLLQERRSDRNHESKKPKTISKYVYLSLFSDMIVVSSVPKGIVDTKTKIKYLVELWKIQSIDSSNDKLNRFSIVIRDHEPFILVSSTSREKNEWIKVLNETISLVWNRVEKETIDVIDNFLENLE